MAKPKIVEMELDDIQRAVNQVLTAIIPLRLDEFELCAALHMILSEMKARGIDMEMVMDAELENLN